MHFTRRHPSCNADENGGNTNTPQIDNCGGFGGSWPTMCAPLYAAKVKLKVERLRKSSERTFEKTIEGQQQQLDREKEGISARAREKQGPNPDSVDDSSKELLFV